MTSITEEKIKEMTDKIVKEFQPEKIILFGSYAWGTPTKDSDVDLFILKKTEESKRECQMRLRRLLIDTGIPVDVLVFHPNEVKQRLNLGDFFVINILNRGMLLYESK